MIAERVPEREGVSDAEPVSSTHLLLGLQGEGAVPGSEEAQDCTSRKQGGKRPASVGESGM